MAILANILAAEDDEIETLGESLDPLAEWSGVALPDLDTAKIAMLHSLLTADLFTDALARYEPVYVSAEGALLLRLADELSERLAQLEEELLEPIAAELAATEEFESAQWEDGAIAAMLHELAELARLAQAQDQALFVWMQRLRSS